MKVNFFFGTMSLEVWMNLEWMSHLHPQPLAKSMQDISNASPMCAHVYLK